MDRCRRGAGSSGRWLARRPAGRFHRRVAGRRCRLPRPLQSSGRVCPPWFARRRGRAQWQRRTRDRMWYPGRIGGGYLAQRTSTARLQPTFAAQGAAEPTFAKSGKRASNHGFLRLVQKYLDHNSNALWESKEVGNPDPPTRSPKASTGCSLHRILRDRRDSGDRWREKIEIRLDYSWKWANARMKDTAVAGSGFPALKCR